MTIFTKDCFLAIFGRKLTPNVDESGWKSTKNVNNQKKNFSPATSNIIKKTGVQV